MSSRRSQAPGLLHNKDICPSSVSQHCELGYVIGLLDPVCYDDLEELFQFQVFVLPTCVIAGRQHCRKCLFVAEVFNDRLASSKVFVVALMLSQVNLLTSGHWTRQPWSNALRCKVANSTVVRSCYCGSHRVTTGWKRLAYLKKALAVLLHFVS